MKRLVNQAGQAAIEMALVLSLIVGFAVFVGNEFRSNNLIAGMVSAPWKSLAGMIQNGVWGPSEDTMSQHPNSFERVITPDGEATR